MSAPVWRVPPAPCGASCLPETEVRRGLARLAGSARTGARLVAVTAALAGGAVLAVLPTATARPLQGWWARVVLHSVGVRVRRTGPAPVPGSLVVANHVSWIDALALITVRPMRLVAKQEVRAWPVVGRLAHRAGAVFLDRSRPRALPSGVAAVHAALRGGDSVAVFAEGTTRCGRARGPLRAASFQAALEAGAPVVPVALSYRDADGRPCSLPAFVGDDTLVSSLRRVAGVCRVHVHVDVLDPLPTVDLAATTPVGRRELTARCAAALEAALTPPPAATPPDPRVPAAPAAPDRPPRGEPARAA